MPIPTLRPLGFGEILDGAFSLYRRNFGLFVATVLMPSAPLLVVGIYYALAAARAFEAAGTPQAASSRLMGPLLLLVAIGSFAMLVVWGAAAKQAAQAFTAQPLPLGDGLRAGIRAFPSLFGAALLALIATVVAALITAVVTGFLAAMAVSIAPVVGIVFMIVMFVAVLLAYAAGATLFMGAIPAIVVEGRGPLEGLSRSWDLLQGAFWRVLGVVTVSIIIAYLPVVAVAFLTGTATMTINPQTTDLPGAGALLAQQALGWVVTVLTTPFVVSALVLNYFDRRVRTEGLDVRVMTEGLALAGD